MIKPIVPVTPVDTGGDVVRANYILTVRLAAAVNELIHRHNECDGDRFSGVVDPNVGPAVFPDGEPLANPVLAALNRRKEGGGS